MPNIVDVRKLRTDMRLVPFGRWAAGVRAPVHLAQPLGDRFVEVLSPAVSGFASGWGRDRGGRG